jgi:hypothetical protein
MAELGPIPNANPISFWGHLIALVNARMLWR